jgi:hypothetical protein
MFRTYGKSLAQLLTAVLIVVASAISDSHVTAAEAVQIVIAFASAGTVYLAPNLPQYRWVKTGLACLLAAAMAAAALVTDGLTGSELVNIVIAGIGVLVTGAAPSVSDTKPPTVVG